MNPRLEGIIERFAESKSITGELSLKYEHYANHVILLDEYFKFNSCYPYASNIDKELLEHINFGRDKTESIDGFFCLIQNSENIIHIDTEEDEVRDWIKDKTNIKFKIVLIQTKKGALDTKNINDLSIILQAHYDEQTNWRKFFAFKDLVSSFMKEKPRFSVEFTVIYTLGANKDNALLSNPNFVYKLDELKKIMKEFFWIEDDSKVKIEFLDGPEILKLFEIQSKSIESVDKIVELSQMTRLEKCGDLAEMRMGTITIKEFLKILYDFDSKRPYQLYEYNVRHSLDETTVNLRISETLQNRSENVKFPLLNNGVTMIVNSMNLRGDTSLELKNIRIVNGCQTSHTILRNCIDNSIYDNVILPVKIIATENEEILSEITFSSNNQNPMQPENLMSLDKNMILLEKAYNDFNLTHERALKTKFFFERRQGQYYNIDRKIVVDIPEQARVFLAVWMRKPHSTLQSKDQTLNEFRSIVKDTPEKLNSCLFKLCIFSSILWCKVYDIIHTKYENYEPGRYHILCAFVYAVIKDIFNSTEYNSKIGELAKIAYLSEQTELIEEKLMPLITESSKLEIVIKNICAVFDNMPSLPKTARGRIHYRKFYLVNVINEIITKINEKDVLTELSSTAN